MSLVVVGPVVIISIVGVVVLLAISEVENRLKVATEFLQELTRLKEINERLAGLESDVSRIRGAVTPSFAGYTDAHPTTVKPVLAITDKKKKDLYDRVMGMNIDGRVLDQFDSEHAV